MAIGQRMLLCWIVDTINLKLKIFNQWNDNIDEKMRPKVSIDSIVVYVLLVVFVLFGLFWTRFVFLTHQKLCPRSENERMIKKNVIDVVARDKIISVR
jgi:hypothetical protein